MKRFALLTTIAAVAAVPATSLADTERLTSSRGGANLAVAFDVDNDVNGDPRVVRNFQFAGFTVECNRGNIELSGFKRRMAVNNDGEFSGGITDGNGVVRIEGDFRRANTQVVGTLEARGRFGQAKGCDGFARWIAQ